MNGRAICRLGAVAAMTLLVACSSHVSPSTPGVPSPDGSGTVIVELEIAPEASQFFASEHHARLVTSDATIEKDWQITGAVVPVSAPPGFYRLQAFTAFLSDFIECAPDPAAAGATTCAQPTLGPAQVCAIPIEIVDGGTIRARFRSLPEGRCELVGVAEPAERTTGPSNAAERRQRST
ncbi:MAG TPA: hypothetical protein VFI34_12425 [Candidatus Limnocylindrales bacterium]|nr:hypothetical protein [Candidatus Limnocylindrales bacterium]